jgi:hypothetical protein
MDCFASLAMTAEEAIDGDPDIIYGAPVLPTQVKPRK